MSSYNFTRTGRTIQILSKYPHQNENMLCETHTLSQLGTPLTKISQRNKQEVGWVGPISQQTYSTGVGQILQKTQTRIQDFVLLWRPLPYGVTISQNMLSTGFFKHLLPSSSCMHLLSIQLTALSAQRDGHACIFFQYNYWVHKEMAIILYGNSD